MLALTIGYILIPCFDLCASALLFVSKFYKLRLLLIQKVFMEKHIQLYKRVTSKMNGKVCVNPRLCYPTFEQPAPMILRFSQTQNRLNYLTTVIRVCFWLHSTRDFNQHVGGVWFTVKLSRQISVMFHIMVYPWYTLILRYSLCFGILECLRARAWFTLAKITCCVKISSTHNHTRMDTFYGQLLN